VKALFVILICSLLAAGCAQPSVQPAGTPQSPEATTGIPAPGESIVATAQRIDSTKILVTYAGGPDADQLIELQTTVIDSRGSVKTQSMNSRLDTTPVQRGGTDIFLGPYTEKVHVLITGYFTNGSHQDILDAWI
jgi:hypothetical protein